jgi:hypothetical protein
MEAHSGSIIQIRIDTETNTFQLKDNSYGLVEQDLYYVIQTRIDYNTDGSGGTQSFKIEGTYATREKALKAARATLLSDIITQDWFGKYLVRDEEEGRLPGEDDMQV